MPIKKSDYPANWATEIVPAIRSRAGEVREGKRIIKEARCEWCGVENHSWICRMEKPLQVAVVRIGGLNGVDKYVPHGDYLPAAKGVRGAVRIILSTAHLDRDLKNNALDNLASLCQRCHLNHDRKAQHIPNRAYGRYHSRQPKLFNP